MIIKSVGRKARSHLTLGKKGSPFAKLVQYMNRGILEEDGKAVLWHNFYGHEGISESEIIATFEANARKLAERKNGNVLYHEMLSFETISGLRMEKLEAIIADIGQEYLNARAGNQLAYGVIHKDTDHIHLHLMISSNAVDKPERIRLSKKEFADIQKQIEGFTLEQYPELNQSRIYGKAERSKERVKTQVHEQAMKHRTGSQSRKEAVKGNLHQIFERANSFEELAELMKTAGFSLYQRGKTVGVIAKDPEGQERKYRLALLGVVEHYEATNRRLLEQHQERLKTPEIKPQPQARQPEPPPKQAEPQVQGKNPEPKVEPKQPEPEAQTKKPESQTKQPKPPEPEMEAPKPSKTPEPPPIQKEPAEKKGFFGFHFPFKKEVEAILSEAENPDKYPEDVAPRPETEIERRMRELQETRNKAKMRDQDKDRSR